MANTLILNSSQVFTGLGTLTYTVASNGLYNVQAQTSEVPPSGLVITVNKNGSPVYTSPTITPTQISLQFKTYPFPCVVTDVVTVVMSSASAIDSQINNVKTSVAIGQGA